MEESTRRLAAIMFTDIAGYTALMQKDEGGAMQLLVEHNSILRSAFQRFNGREVKSMGDSFLVEFPSALDAVRCARTIQENLVERNLGVPVDKRIELKIGVHVGDVIVSDGDILGDAVNVASRLQPLCEPGGICISGQVYENVKHKTSQQFVKVSNPLLKNVVAPIDVYRSEPDLSRDERSELDKYRVAVLPFKSMSPDPNDEYFADGVTEEIITALSGIGGLAVIARTSTASYKAAARRVSEIGRELGAGTVVEGSVRKAAGVVRVTVQVIDSQKEQHLWAQNYDKKLEDVFALQSEIAQKVAESLKVTILDREREVLGAGSTHNAEAYDKYLLAKSFVREKKIKYLEESVNIDPNFALAYTALANAYTMALGDFVSPKEAFEKSDRYLKRALELDDRMAEAWTSKGNLLFQYEWNWEEAEKCLNKAIELNPSFDGAYFMLAVMSMLGGRFDKAVELAKKAAELNPRDVYTRYALSDSYALAGRNEDALRELGRLKELHPEDLNTYNVCALLNAQMGTIEDATNELDTLRERLRAKSLTGWDSGIDSWTYAVNSFIYTRIGRTQDARSMLREAELKSRTRYVSVADMAAIHLAIGDRESAFELFRKAVETREASPFYWVWWCFDPFRKDPEFVSLLHMTGAPESLLALGS